LIKSRASEPAIARSAIVRKTAIETMGPVTPIEIPSADRSRLKS
jgi:hypothetical protein